MVFGRDGKCLQSAKARLLLGGDVKQPVLVTSVPLQQLAALVLLGTVRGTSQHVPLSIGDEQSRRRGATPAPPHVAPWGDRSDQHQCCGRSKTGTQKRYPPGRSSYSSSSHLAPAASPPAANFLFAAGTGINPPSVLRPSPLRCIVRLTILSRLDPAASPSAADFFLWRAREPSALWPIPLVGMRS